MSTRKPSRSRQIAGMKVLRTKDAVAKMLRAKDIRDSEADELRLCLDATIHTLEVVKEFDAEIASVVLFLRAAAKAGTLEQARTRLEQITKPAPVGDQRGQA